MSITKGGKWQKNPRSLVSWRRKSQRRNQNSDPKNKSKSFKRKRRNRKPQT